MPIVLNWWFNLRFSFAGHGSSRARSNPSSQPRPQQQNSSAASTSAVGSCISPQAMDCDFQPPPRPYFHHNHHHRTRYQVTGSKYPSSLPYEMNEPTAIGYPLNNGQDPSSSKMVFLKEKLNSGYFNSSNVDGQLSYPSYGSYSLQSSSNADGGTQSNSKRQTSNVQPSKNDRDDSPLVVGCLQQSPVASHWNGYFSSFLVNFFCNKFLYHFYKQAQILFLTTCCVTPTAWL